MIKIIENSDVEDMIFKQDYILIMCKKMSSEVIKQLGRKLNKVGIYCRNGHIIDTVNGVISNIDKKINFDYEIIGGIESKQLVGVKDYKLFADFIKMKEYFLKYYKITLYWDETKTKCIFEKTTPLDYFGGFPADGALNHMKFININSEIFKKIKFVPNLEETLNSFVDETKVGEFYIEKD